MQSGAFQRLQMLAAPVRTCLENQDSAPINHLKVPLHIIFQDAMGLVIHNKCSKAVSARVKCIICYWDLYVCVPGESPHGSDSFMLAVRSRCVCEGWVGIGL